MGIVVPHRAQLIIPEKNKSDANKSIIVAFDVDGTLISIRDDTPRYEIISLFKAFQSFGCRMIIWSLGGTDYAQEWANKLGLSAEIIDKGSIVPDITFDDNDGIRAKVSIGV